MSAEENLITTEVLEDAKAREIDFAEFFSESVKKLVEALGVTRKIAKQAGTLLKTYKAVGELEDGNVEEGVTIPLSAYSVEPAGYKEITIEKWRKATTAEAIIEKGFDQAVTMTTDRMLKDVQKHIRKKFFDFLKDSGADDASVPDPDGEEASTPKKDKGTTTSGKGLQGALAAAWGKLQVLFEDDDVNTVFFVHPSDVADYLATAGISTQNAFGLSYVKDFMGLGTLIMNSSVTPKSIYATAADNIVLYYIPVNGADLNDAFEFTSDVTGYIGIHEEPDYTNMTASDTVISGIELFAERIDGIVTATITA